MWRDPRKGTYDPKVKIYMASDRRNQSRSERAQRLFSIINFLQNNVDKKISDCTPWKTSSKTYRITHNPKIDSVDILFESDILIESRIIRKSILWIDSFLGSRQKL